MDASSPPRRQDYTVLVFPDAMAERRFSDASFPILVAHRGDPLRRPENSIEGFLSALRAGADAVEFDVRLTRDAEPVIMHDADVARTTDGRGLVHELSLAEVRSLRLAGTSRVPTLAEALEAVGSLGGGVDIEIKNLPGEPGFEPEAERTLEATLSALREARFSGSVLISSFNPTTIRRSIELAPEVPTGLLIIDAVDPSDALGAAIAEAYAFILPSVASLVLAGPAMIRGAHEAGVRVGAWTADDPGTVRRLLEWEVDAVATNDPAMAAVAWEAWRAERGR
jgi:glycerophosphoryl diester phosphodiesterase